MGISLLLFLAELLSTTATATAPADPLPGRPSLSLAPERGGERSLSRLGDPTREPREVPVKVTLIRRDPLLPVPLPSRDTDMRYSRDVEIKMKIELSGRERECVCHA